MTSSFKNTLSFFCFICWSIIYKYFLFLSNHCYLMWMRVILSFLVRNNVDCRHFREYDFWFWLFQNIVDEIPTCTFYKKTVNINTSIRRIYYFFIFWSKSKRECQRINWNFILSGKVLFNSSEEWLCKIESWQPEIHRCSIINPIL